MNKKLTKNLIIILIVFTTILLATDNIQAEIKGSEQIQTESNASEHLNDFISSIYNNYKKGEFQEVYQLLHPGIQENLTEEEYVDFQQHNKERYQLELSEIEIIEIKSIDTLPSKFNKYLSEEEYEKAYEANVEYKMEFRFLGSNRSRDVDTETYLVESDGQLYLIWDRSVIEEDDPGAGIE